MDNRFKSRDPVTALQNELEKIREDIRQLQQNRGVKWTIKTTAGAPGWTGYSGWFVENTNDNTLHVWSNGAWRQIFP